MNDLLQPLKDQFNEASSIAIIGHRDIDGDSVGSCLAFGTLLENQGKDVRYFSPTKPSPSFSFLNHIEKFGTDFVYDEYDIVLMLDIANPEHMISGFRNGHESYFEKQHTIVIDHHLSNTLFGDLNIVDDTCMSTCELLTEIFQELYPDEITEEIATYLFLGVSTDTGNFVYDKDSARTFANAHRLLEKGAEKKRIVQNMYRSNSLEQMQFIGEMITRIKEQGNVIYSWYTAEELKEKGLDKEAVEGFLPLMTSIQHDGVFALFKTSGQDTTPSLRISLRANNEHQDVSDLASHFNGGGHKAAAGCKIPLTEEFHTMVEKTVEKMNRLLPTSI